MSDEKQETRTILERYARQNRDTRQIDDSVAEDEGEDDFNAFGWLRGIRDRAIMLQLRKKDGNIDAPSYSLLERAEFDPSEGITLHFAGQKVRIRGQNLNKEIRPSIRLFEGIARHRVPWIQEGDVLSGHGDHMGGTMVESISC